MFRKGKKGTGSRMQDEEPHDRHHVKDITIDAVGKTEDEKPRNLAQTAQDQIFHWKNVNYSIKIKDETRDILTDIESWVQPGTLTALMVSIAFAPKVPHEANAFRESPVPVRRVFSICWLAEPGSVR